MAKVSPYHTKNDENEPPSHRNVYHNHDDCHYGKSIKPQDRVSGSDNRPRCSRCVELG